jgi:hypothetical protein
MKGRRGKMKQYKPFENPAPENSSAPAQSRRRDWSLGRGLGNVWLWTILGFGFMALQFVNPGSREGVSKLWFFDPLLEIGFIVGLILNSRRVVAANSGSKDGFAGLVYVALSWLVAMAYELSLSEGVGSFGGFHERTIPSFLLAQGYYLPFAILGLFLIRRYRYTFQELFLAAGAASVYEAMQIGVPGFLASPLFFLLPLVIGYYVLVYGMFLAWPLIVIDERTLWSPKGREIGFGRKVLLGIGLGGVCWLLQGMWSLLLSMAIPGMF